MKASDFGWRLPLDREVEVEVVETSSRIILVIVARLGHVDGERYEASRNFSFPLGLVLVFRETER